MNYILKKSSILFLYISVFCSIVFAQSISAKNAAFRTAERCLKLSENYLLSGDIQSAYSQAEMGMTYDDSISDLYYIKAVCSKNMGKTVREVIELSETARQKNRWIGYNEKGNRILLSDLLSDTGRLEEALEELDRSPFVFSADAEAVRVKTYYRIGSDEYIKKAREKTNSARRIYKGDSRFLNLFFYFEMARSLEMGVDYIPDVKALQMADVLTQEMKNYKDISPETECISLFFQGFSDREKQLRGLMAFEAEGKEAFLFPIEALQSGYWDEDKSFDEFTRYAEDSCTIELFSYFLGLLKKTENIQRFSDYLNSWNGILYEDSNRDMQWETEVCYERGRPASISFDYNNDGVIDLLGKMDFGELLSVKINPLESELFYSDFPYLGRAVVLKQLSDQPGSLQKKESVIFDFSKESALYSPIRFTEPFSESLTEALLDKNNKDDKNENRFFVPEIKSGWNDPLNLLFLENATFARVPLSESENENKNACVTYSLLKGKVVSAVYSQNDQVYATADFSDGLPTDRYADYDMDGVFETHEIFELFTEDNIDLFTDEDKKQVKELFPYYSFENKVYISSVQIDSNNDNVPEYKEYFREKGGKISVWIKGDGHSESYTRFPCNEGEPLVEESVFVVGLNYDTVSVMTVGGEPSSVKINEAPYKIIKGELPDFYWIQNNLQSQDSSQNNGAAEIEIYSALFNPDQSISQDSGISDLNLNGKLFVLDKKEVNKFYRAIRVSGKIYAMEFLVSQESENEE